MDHARAQDQKALSRQLGMLICKRYTAALMALSLLVFVAW